MPTASLPAFPLRKMRVHEVCGPAAPSFAAIAAAQVAGNLLWVRERWRAERLSPLGLRPFLDPARLLIAGAKDGTEVLAVAEEALRDGSVPFVILEMSGEISFTAGRRLQLAAKAGRSTGLCLIPEGMGCNAAETRWRCTPVADPEATPGNSTLQRWEIIKNKSGTLGVWHVRWDQSARRLAVVSPARE